MKQMLVIRAGIHKMLNTIANREDPDQTASLETVWSGSALFGVLQETSVQNFRTFTVSRDNCPMCKCNVNHYHVRYFLYVQYNPIKSIVFEETPK